MTAIVHEPRDDAEARRLELLRDYNILDTPPEVQFDRIARLAAALLNTPIAAVTLVDEDRQWFKAQVGLERSELPRSESLCSVAITGDRPMIVEDASLDTRFAQNRLVHEDGGIRFYLGVPLRTPDGAALGTLCAIDRTPRQVTPRDVALMQDLAELAMEQLELRHAASEDALTGVLRRGAFLAAAERDLAVVRRNDRRLGCLMIDVDHFKTINDRFGHATGDRVLVALTDTIRACLRRSDLVGRLGGEEFCVLLADTGEEGALDVANRLLRSVRATSVVAADGRVVTFSVSIGGTEVLSLDSGFDLVMARADGALYRAKHEGRDCIRWRAPA